MQTFGNVSSDDSTDIVIPEHDKGVYLKVKYLSGSGIFSHETSSSLKAKWKELGADVTTHSLLKEHLLLKMSDYEIDTAYEQMIIIENLDNLSYAKYTDGKVIGITMHIIPELGRYDEVYQSCRLIFANNTVNRETCRSTVSVFQHP